MKNPSLSDLMRTDICFRHASIAAGDSWVDWVGMSSFHFGGLSYPFTQNAEAAPNAFTAGVSTVGSSVMHILLERCLTDLEILILRLNHLEVDAK